MPAPAAAALRRLAMHMLYIDGLSQEEVARQLKLSRGAVAKWAALYKSGGEPALETSKAKRGPPARMSDDEARVLMHEARAAGLTSLAEIVSLAHRMGIKVGRYGIRRRLVALGLWPL